MKPYTILWLMSIINLCLRILELKNQKYSESRKKGEIFFIGVSDREFDSLSFFYICSSENIFLFRDMGQKLIYEHYFVSYNFIKEFFRTFKNVCPDGFVMKELTSDLEQGIISAMNFEFGGCKHHFDIWHLFRCWSTKASTLPHLTLKTLVNEFPKVKRLVWSLVHVPLQIKNIRNAAISLISNEVKKYKPNGKPTKKYKQL